MGGGGAFSTPRDYMAFLQALLNGGALHGVRILRPETVAMMMQNQIGELNVQEMRSAQPPYSRSFDQFPGQQHKWGLSFDINMQPGPNGRSAGSISWAGLLNCYFWLDPVKHVTGALFTQVLPFYDERVVALYGAFERGLYAGLALSPRDRTSTFWRTIMYAITGITGKVGGALARSLLAERLPVRAVLRDEAKAAEWRTRGCDVALAEMDDAASLTSAFKGAAGVFILPPSEFDPEPGFPEAKRVIAAVTAALAEARPGKVVCLSTIGADAPHENLLTQRTLMEHSLEEIGLPVTFLRPGWFMENALWDVPSARDEGVLRSFLQPVDKLFPMVATQDVGRLAAALLREDWIGMRVVELEGPARVSPNDLARAFAAVLKRPVRVETVPRESWEQIFRSQGTQNPLPRIRMLDGFNEGWIEFSDHGRSAVKGTTTLDSVIAELVEASRAKAAA